MDDLDPCKTYADRFGTVWEFHHGVWGWRGDASDHWYPEPPNDVELLTLPPFRELP